MSVGPTDHAAGMMPGPPQVFVPPAPKTTGNPSAERTAGEPPGGGHRGAAVVGPPLATPRPDYLARLDATLDQADKLLAHLADPLIDVPVSIIMPVYNERQTIDRAIERVLAVPMPLELIIVDDCSTDGTRERLEELAERLPIRLLLHKRNVGKGAALRTGFRAAAGEVVAIQDADLEYDPAELPLLVKPIAAGCCDVVFGSRYLAEGENDPSRLHRLGNGLLTRMSNLLTGQKLTDMETCYKVMRRSALDGIVINENGFGCEPELTAKLARRRARIYELPISYQGRGYKDGKKIRARDALRAVWCIVRYAWAD